MSKSPPTEERNRMVMRVLVVFLGLLAFRAAGDDRIAAGLLLWAGVIFVGFAVVDWITLRGKDSGLMRVGTLVLGLGLVGAGLLQL